MTDHLPAKEAPATPLQKIKNALGSMAGDFAPLLEASSVSFERFQSVALMAVSNSKDLGEVAMTPEGRKSIVQACLSCAKDGLVPDNQEACIVKFKVKIKEKGQPDRWEARATYMPMVRGVLNKLQENPDVIDVGVFPVYAKEHFDARIDSDGVNFEHKPMFFGDRGPMVGMYAYLRLKQGGVYFEPMNMQELAAIEGTSKGDYGPWKGPFKPEMQKKSVLKRLAKRAPVTRQVRDILAVDNQFHDLDGEVVEGKPSLLEKMKGRILPAPEPEATVPMATVPIEEPETVQGELIQDPPKETVENPAPPKEAAKKRPEKPPKRPVDDSPKAIAAWVDSVVAYLPTLDPGTREEFVNEINAGHGIVAEYSTALAQRITDAL